MAWVLRHGGGPSFLSLLTVRGRNSGQPRSTPVAPVRRGDDVWVVAPYGPVSWVRNVQAAGRLELRRGNDRRAYDVRELDAEDAVPILRAYLSMPSARFVRREFDVTARSSDDAIAAEAPRHPVFALTPADPDDGRRDAS
jgi:deazaflavin-dependent oxidoreductase (nitroreductase family)